MKLETFWFVLTVACLVWYATISLYVAVRAVWDIRRMLRRLGSVRDDESDGGADDASGGSENDSAYQPRNG